MQKETRQAVLEGLAKRAELEHGFIAKAWESDAYRQELLSDPKAFYKKETGQDLPEDIKIEIIEETPGTIKMVLPQKPASLFAEDELTEEALELVAGGGIRIRIDLPW
jgi:hypothetical protein